MLTASRALVQNAESSPELPRVEALRDLYAWGVHPRKGEVMMVAGRSGTQKSGFALWWTAEMNVPTLYMSADMSGFQASVRLACMKTGQTTEEVEAGMAGPRAHEYTEALADLKTTFAFGGPITWSNLDSELEAYVELWDAYPDMIVLDNLMDIEGADSDYAGQMDAMQNISAISRETGASMLVLHHASDKSWDAKTDPWSPPSRSEVKGGLSEKPELTLSVALDPESLDYRIACIKQRMGPSDPTAKRFVTLKCEPDKTRFHAYDAYSAYRRAT